MVNLKLVEGDRLAAVKMNFSVYLEKEIKGSQSRTNFHLAELVLLMLSPSSFRHLVSKLKDYECGKDV